MIARAWPRRPVRRRVVSVARCLCTVALTVALTAALPAALTATAQTAPPELAAPVNDFAEVIDPGSERAIDSLIRQLQGATGDAMVVATVKTFQPWADLNSYAVEMFRNGGKGIGTTGKDNGVLIVLAVDDRQVWIETGYGLEGFITDGFAGETSRAMAAFFRTGDYGAGLVEGATRVAERVAQGRNVTLVGGAPRVRETRERGSRFPPGLIIILLIIFLNLMGGGKRGRGMRRSSWVSGVGPFGGGFGGGGSWGGGGGGFGGGFGGGRSGGGGGGAGW